MQGQFRFKRFIFNTANKARQVRISTQSNSKGCENPKALSSITMAGEIAAMKNYRNKTLHSRRKT